MASYSIKSASKGSKLKLNMTNEIIHEQSMSSVIENQGRPASKADDDRQKQKYHQLKEYKDKCIHSFKQIPFHNIQAKLNNLDNLELKIL